MPVSVLLILGLGAAVGFISGLFGIGGGFLMTPLPIFSASRLRSRWRPSQLRSSPRRPPAPWARCAGTPSTPSSAGCWLPADSSVRRSSLVFRRRSPSRPARSRDRGLVRDALYGRRQPDAEGEHSGSSGRSAVAGGPAPAPGRRPCAYLAWPLRMRFYRSKLYVSVIPVLGLSLFVGFAGALLGIGGGFIVVPALLYVFQRSDRGGGRHVAVPDPVHDHRGADPARLPNRRSMSSSRSCSSWARCSAPSSGRGRGVTSALSCSASSSRSFCWSRPALRPRTRPPGPPNRFR